jgi:hypothetical protein
MTRRQVAQRLGKSVAAVRRLEGVLLHPATDAKGIHRFDTNEVEALVDRIGRGEVTIWHELRDSGPFCLGESAEQKAEPCSRCSALAAALEESTRERDHQQRALASIREERERERVQNAADQRHLERQLSNLIRQIESL